MVLPWLHGSLPGLLYPFKFITKSDQSAALLFKHRPKLWDTLQLGKLPRCVRFLT